MKLNEFIEAVEGASNEVYLDAANLPTIGVGHLLTKDELSTGRLFINDEWVQYGGGLTSAQVEQLLEQDLRKYSDLVKNAVTVPLTENQFIALVSFCFNVGIGAFLHSTLLRLLNDRKYDEVPKQLRRWIWCAGRKNRGLANRREKEIIMWNGGNIK